MVNATLPGDHVTPVFEIMVPGDVVFIRTANEKLLDSKLTELFVYVITREPSNFSSLSSISDS